jgi:transcriptional accessory protein Tex/SPT6
MKSNEVCKTEANAFGKHKKFTDLHFIIQTVLQVDQLNVNTASEEELMTLPGITRTIAQNIVEYRQAIGTFKKV